jgi:Domain of unknown function (DUF4157)
MFAPKVAKPQQKATTYSLANQRSPFPAHQFGQSAGEHSLLPERPTGNEAVKLREADPEGVAARAEPGGAAWNFCLVPLHTPGQPNRRLPFSSLAPFPMPAPLQPKLAVGRADDPLEREADAVAEQVMRMPTPAQLSRKCAECEAEEEEKAKKIQTKPAGSAGPAAEAPAIVHEVLRSPGQPLDAATRAFFEPRFGYDFSDIRVHADPRAAESARSVDAMAYTVGQDLVFSAGRYAPGTIMGQRLIAHELAHTIQQAGENGSGSRRLRVHNTVSQETKIGALEGSAGMVQRQDVAPAAPVQASQRLPGEGFTDCFNRVYSSLGLGAAVSDAIWITCGIIGFLGGTVGTLVEPGGGTLTGWGLALAGCISFGTGVGIGKIIGVIQQCA